jgi:hypothetical protein
LCRLDLSASFLADVRRRNILHSGGVAFFCE